jgi:hypothetical protein
MTPSAKSGGRCVVSAVVSNNERPASRDQRHFRFLAPLNAKPYSTGVRFQLLLPSSAIGGPTEFPLSHFELTQP